MGNLTYKPELQFPEFVEGRDNFYKKHSFKNIFLFSTGKNIKQNEASPEFETPCVRYGELYHLYGEVINEVINKTNLDRTELLFSDGDELLLPSAGEDPLDIGSASALTVEKVAIGRTINILKPLKENIYSQIYVAYYINQRLKRRISSLAKGVSISNVYNSDLKKLEIILPVLKEQKKVANFLTAVDERIQLLHKKKNKLEEYKKGVMQKLFSQEIRFKDENGDNFPEWEEKKLGNLTTITKGKQLNKSELTDTGEYPCQNGGIEPSGYTHEYNNEANTITISEGGNSCGYVNYMKSKFWCGGHCYALIDLKESIIPNFLYQALKYNQNNLMRLRVGSGLPNIQMGDVRKFQLELPSKLEQQKIAEFLKSLDESIESIEVEINGAKKYKKGLLQKMFV